MKKDIVRQLNKVAETTPIVFEWAEREEMFTGEELNLTPLGDVVKFKPDETYPVPMPAMVAVDHHKQFKDAYNRGGWPAVKEYHSGVMAKVKTASNKITLQQ